MKLDLTKREVSAWVNRECLLIDQEIDAAARRDNAATELASIERHGLQRVVPNMIKALKALIAHIDAR